MAEIRRDVVSGVWVIIATERASRPRDFFVQRATKKAGFCPFCEGNEDRTPPEVAAVRPPATAPDTPGWQVRVVPNKFPALRLEGSLDMQDDGIYQKVAGVGAHEVIIESPRHLVSPTEMATADFELVIRVYCERFRALYMDERLVHVLIFKNVGEAAGASLEHSHSQLIAVPVMPRRVQEETQHCETFYERKGRCLVCELVKHELQQGVRVVLETDEFAVLSPYAARFPFEMCIVPKRHAPHFHEMDASMVSEFARVLQEALVRLEVCLKRPPYNFAIHTAPVRYARGDCYHWHLELMPAVTRMAGFEWGSGFYINPMEPEKAAQFLREVPEDEIKHKIGSVAAAGKASR